MTRVACGAGALLLWLCFSASAQQAPPVMVYAVVIDQAGAPLHGLAATDFRLAEDGKDLPITAFQARGGREAAGATQPQRLVLMLAPQSAEALQWLQPSLVKFITANAAPGRLMDIFFTDSCYTTSSTPFSGDPAELRSVLDPWPDLLHCAHPAEAGGYLRAAYYAQVAQSLALMPGHKTVLMFLATAGPLADPVEAKPPEAAPPPQPARRGKAKSEHAAEPHQDPFDMEHEFRKADASVYPVEAQPGAALPAWAQSLAAMTGGHGLIRNNSGDVLDTLAHELDSAYTLAFVPGLSAEGSCHELKITVNRPGAKVLGRNLYCNIVALNKGTPIKPRDSALDALAASSETGDIEASAAAPFFYAPSGMARVNVALEIPAPVLEPTDRNGKLHSEMEVLGVAYVPSGEIAARFTHRMKFDFDTRQQFEEFLKQPMHYERQFEIPAGKYHLRLVFRSSKEHLGAVEVPLSIDPFNFTQLGLSAIALSRKVEPITSEAAQDETDAGRYPLIFRGNRITVSGSDLLPRAGTAEAFFEVYEPNAAVQLSMRLRVFDGRNHQERWNSGDVDLSALAKPGGPAIPVAVVLPTGKLPAGAYHAELTVKDSKGGGATRSVDFRTQ